MKNNGGLKSAPEKRKLIPSKGFFMDFVKNYQNTWFTEHLYVAASGLLKWQVL